MRGQPTETLKADRAPSDHPPAPVTIVAPPGATLGAALSAALQQRGWVPVLISWSELPGRTRTPTVVLVEDDEGLHAAPPTIKVPRCVCVGTVRSLGQLIRLADQGSTVIDQASPFLVLVHAVDEALRTLDGPAPHTDAGPRLRDRLREHTSLGRLTAPERATLHALMDGRTAAEIADDTQRSLHTVRSHIKAVLAKLGVTSQLAAVSMAHRAGCFPDRAVRQATFTNIGDDAHQGPR